MSILVGDRVLETSTTAGTGTLTLAGAATGYQAFANGVGVGNQTYYCIFDPTANTWEVGIGTLLTGTTLSRTTVYANSSGTTALISFAANSKNVFCTAPATRYVDQSDVGYAPNQIPLNQMLGKLAFQDSKAISSTGTLGFGLNSGVGGAVTQLTSRTTGVTLNNSTGAIALFSAAGSTTAATFTVTNSQVAVNDVIILNQQTGANLYVLLVTKVLAGSFNITLYTTGGTTTEAPIINFAVIKGSAS
jgi:hypothetical protein